MADKPIHIKDRAIWIPHKAGGEHSCIGCRSNSCSTCGSVRTTCFRKQGLRLWCLMPLSTIFQLYRGGQFYCWRSENLKKTTDPSQVTDKLYHIMLYRVHFVWVGFDLTTSVVIYKHWLHIGSFKFNYPTITITTAPLISNQVLRHERRSDYSELS